MKNQKSLLSPLIQNFSLKIIFIENSIKLILAKFFENIYMDNRGFKKRGKTKKSWINKRTK